MINLVRRLVLAALHLFARGSIDAIGPGSQVAVLVRKAVGSRVTVGEACTIRGRLVLSSADARLSIGNNVLVNARSTIETFSEVTIGDDVLIAFDVLISDTRHHSSNWVDRTGDLHLLRTTGTGDPRHMDGTPIHIGDGVWIGARSTILPGVTIGDGATVGAGSVVTKDVAPFSLVAGNPAVPRRDLPAVRPVPWASRGRQPG